MGFRGMGILGVMAGFIDGLCGDFIAAGGLGDGAFLLAGILGFLSAGRAGYFLGLEHHLVSSLSDQPEGRSGVVSETNGGERPTHHDPTEGRATPFVEAGPMT